MDGRLVVVFEPDGADVADDGVLVGNDIAWKMTWNPFLFVYQCVTLYAGRRPNVII